jgi:predicted alpha/beta hydrolase
VLNETGYVVLNFDYKGWGDSEGPTTRLAPYSRVADVQAALTFLAAQPEVEASRLGLYGTSYGGATRGLGCRDRFSGPMHGLGSWDRQRRALDAQRAPAG